MAAAVNPPLTLGEILDRTIQIYRRNFLLFVGISLAPSACYVLVYGGASLYFASHLSQFQPGPNTSTTPDLNLIVAFMGIAAGFFIIGLPLLLATSSLSLSALNFAASRRSNQQAVTVRESYGHAFKKFWRYLGIFTLQLLFAGVIPGTVFGGIVVIGVISAALLKAAGTSQALAALAFLTLIFLFVTLAVVMVLIWLRFSLAFPASLVEDLKIWPAMQRSNRLSKGSRGRIFVMYILVVILVVVLYYALTLPVDLVLGLIFFKHNQLATLFTKPPIIVGVINLFISFLQRAFTLPIYAIALVLFYNDQRTRHEGYDIELLMAQAGWITAPTTVPANLSSGPGFSAAATPPPDPALAWGPPTFTGTVPAPFEKTDPEKTEPEKTQTASDPTNVGAPGLASEAWASTGQVEPAFTGTTAPISESEQALIAPKAEEASSAEAGVFNPLNTTPKTNGASAPEPPQKPDTPTPPPEATEA